MFWAILALVGGGTFLVNGFSVLTDPSCASVDFSGGRAVLATCYESPTTGAVSGNLAGIGMMLFGLLLGLFALRTFARGR
jgi:hypothetical protein